jgi:hypothetical protein
MDKSIVRKFKKQLTWGGSQPWGSKLKQLPLHITHGGWLVNFLAIFSTNSLMGHQVLSNNLKSLPSLP